MFQLQGEDLHDFGIDLTQVTGNKEITHTHTCIKSWDWVVCTL